MEQQIRAYLLKGYSINEIKHFLQLNDEDFKREFKKIVLNLENDPNLLRCLRDRDDFVVGKIEINRRGTGYVNFGSKKVIIDTQELNSALNGDLVLVTSRKVGKDKLYSVEEIIERKDGLVVVNYINGEFVPLSVPFDYQIDLSDEDKSKLKPNDRVLVKVNDVKTGKVTAVLKEVIGHKDDIALREKTIVAEHGFPLSFNASVEKELERVPDKVIPSDYVDHIDFRSKIVFTIDDIDTQDIDDALYYERGPNGHHIVGIPVSHVSHYVKDNGAIHHEAIERGTSVYVGKHSHPMLPRKLCDGIGSLNENEDRLTRTMIIEFDENYEIVNYKIVKAVIRSRKKMTYDDVDKILMHDSVPEGYQEFYKDLRELDKINDALEARKRNRGVLNFYGNDVKTIFGTAMNPIGFKPLRNSKSRLLIENFALLANELYDKYFYNIGVRNIKRIEEAPDIDKINKMIQRLNACGFNFNEMRFVENRGELNSILDTLRRSDNFPAYSSLLLRGMPKAKYSLLALGHYALVLLFYCQMTSPIRRIGDFTNHKILDKIDLGLPIGFSDEELVEIALHASQTEREADAASYAALRSYMAEYMKNYIGEEFRGTIFDTSSTGLTIKADNEVIGRVSPKNIMNGKFKYVPDMYCFYDPSQRIEYHVGDDVNVLVKNSNIELGTVDFSLIGHYEKPKKYKKEHKNKYKKTA